MKVEIPALPNSTAPEPEPWITAAAEALGEPDGRTAVVGHSLGCVTALHALDRLDGDWKLDTLIAVSGFVSPTPALPELDPFTRAVPNVALRLPRILSTQFKRHVSTRGEPRRADLADVCSGRRFASDR
ncbi:hypothetical protein HCN51_51255 [Nonomuraea sp. FMUSA5-5]|uniref:Alpha/beta hydrolase n=1 Tax=Nonomuraea composti TaxID=2720023 RepID=A0ABX1BMV1_9ACTN|nr:hypothetical protein [Nonomuraea sp. FMUSA5-5]